MPVYPGSIAELKPAQKIELEINLAILEAEEELAGAYGPVPDSRVYDLVLLATDSEERASAAQAARWLARLKRNETPEV